MRSLRLTLRPFLLFCTVALAPGLSFAASQDELMEKIKQLEVQIQQLKDLKEQQRLSVVKEQQCLAAIGDKKFCGCIAEALPLEVSFERYIHIVVSTSDELRYSALKTEEQKNIDGARAAREKCLSKGFFK